MYSSSSFFVQTRLRTRSSSFLVQVAPQRVPGHPEAKSGQNLIRNSLLEAILVTGGGALCPGQVRRKNSSLNGYPAFRRKNSSKRLSLACWLACWPAGLQNGLQEAISNEDLITFGLRVSGDPLGANLDEKTRRSRLRVHLVEKTRA